MKKLIKYIFTVILAAIILITIFFYINWNNNFLNKPQFSEENFPMDGVVFAKQEINLKEYYKNNRMIFNKYSTENLKIINRNPFYYPLNVKVVYGRQK